MAKAFQEHLWSLGLELPQKAEYLHGESVAKALAAELDKSKSPELAVRVFQTLCVDPKARKASEHPRITDLTKRLAEEQPQMVVKDRAVNLARALVIACGSSLKKPTTYFSLMWAGRDLLRHVAVRCKDGTTLDVAGVLEEARKAVDALVRLPESSYELAVNQDQRIAALRVESERQKRRQDLLWWAEAGWSALRHEELSAIAPGARGPWMVEEYARLAGGDGAAESFLLRTLRAEGVPLEDPRARGEWATATARILGDHAARPAVPAALRQILEEDPTGFPLTSALAGLKVRAQDDKIDARQWYREMFRERQVVHQLYPRPT